MTLRTLRKWLRVPPTQCWKKLLPGSSGREPGIRGAIGGPQPSPSIRTGLSWALRYFGVFVPGHCHVGPEAEARSTCEGGQLARTSWKRYDGRATRCRTRRGYTSHISQEISAKLKRQDAKICGRRGTPHGRTIGILEALRIGQLITPHGHQNNFD